MSPVTLLRWSRFAFLLSGICIILFFGLHPKQGDPPAANVILATPYAAEHTLGVMTLVLGLLGLVGIYAALAQTRGWLALIAFLLAFIGSALLIGVVFIDGYLAPILAADAPQLLSASSPLTTTPPPLFLLVPGVLWSLGYVMLGVTVLLTRGTVRWAGIALIVGALLESGTAPLPFTGEIVGAMLVGVGQIWIGYVLWAGKGGTLSQKALVA